MENEDLMGINAKITSSDMAAVLVENNYNSFSAARGEWTSVNGSTRCLIREIGRRIEYNKTSKLGEFRLTRSNRFKNTNRACEKEYFAPSRRDGSWFLLRKL